MARPKTERAELYKDHLVQILLSKFLSSELEVLEPVFDSERGYRYPIVEAILGDSAEIQDFLYRLSEAGVLEKKLHDKILLCPKCSSPRIAVHYNCPHCKSFDVKKSSLIEHLKCGYIDTEDHFQKQSKLICPKCGKKLARPDVDYKKAGMWCTCNNCGKNFDIPVPSHFCRNCDSHFIFEDSIYKEYYEYRLSEEAKEEASLGWILIAPIKEFLESLGFEVETPGFLKGKSGASHMFDITAFHPDVSDEVMVIDLATSSDNSISEQPVIAMFAKIYDVAPTISCLIAVPKTTENGKKMAKLYNIALVEASNPSEAVKGLRKKVSVDKRHIQVKA